MAVGRAHTPPDCVASASEGRPMRRRALYLGVAGVLGLFLAAAWLGATSPVVPAGTASARPLSATTSASDPQRGIIALGHSALTGENSDPQDPFLPAVQNSWATGTNPAVDSIYQRLAAVDPASLGHAFNAAFGGAPAATLVDQATQALTVEPNPRLVIIEIIGTDILCDGSDSSNYPVFGQQVKAALDLLATQAPDATILLVSWAARPLQV